MASCEPDATEPSAAGLSAAQRARIERNRLHARALHEARLVTRSQSNTSEGAKQIYVGKRRAIDTGGGFLTEAESAEGSVGSRAVPGARPAPLVHASQQPRCKECQQLFPQSYLFDTFDFSVCDDCRLHRKGRRRSARTGDAHRGQERVPAERLRPGLAAATAALRAPAQPSPHALRRDASVPARAGRGARAARVGLRRAAAAGTSGARGAPRARAGHRRPAPPHRAAHGRALQSVRRHARAARAPLRRGELRRRDRTVHARLPRLRPHTDLREDVTPGHAPLIYSLSLKINILYLMPKTNIKCGTIEC
ncbi:uncharacterized protein LOC106710903 isoform X1 [Papilio machaon]|uniref:uncharacterized protein LOC106710903 isoform X1 n=1 Tax=Papilio machaon TaxID=76193 RepID=UPI001E663192|nr:uncharacterized protein LOC106710903 isoform X1 [Papilio machaon]XP_045537131.1 uncharacterized protein LOC106710903 isoform X1 [Papilio machaon]